jgi:uncharacterized membrane protein YdfJ with MMPL/SSD domain
MTLLSKANGIPRLRQAKTTRTVWHRVVAAISEPDLTAIVAFCAIGLLITLNVILRFPDLGILIESYNKF